MIIDADSPVENVAVADRIRGAALGGAEMDAHFFQLTSLGIQSVPNRVTALDSIPFAFQPRTYNGVTLNMSEASEILRNNEAMRDTVINRVCQGDAAGCGGAVHAAAVALIHDTEEDTAGKIRRVIETCRTTRPRTVILMTAGWPYRDPAGLRLDDRARELRALGATLSVWHLPSSISYGALVADASAALATRTSGTLTVLKTERDAQRARTAYVRADPGAGHDPSPSAGVPPASGAPLPRTFDDAQDATLRLAALVRRPIRGDVRGGHLARALHAGGPRAAQIPRVGDAFLTAHGPAGARLGIAARVAAA